MEIVHVIIFGGVSITYVCLYISNLTTKVRIKGTINPASLME